MKRKGITLFLAFIVGVLFLFASGCTTQKEGGALSLDLSFSNSIPNKTNRTILPNVDMDVNYYNVTLNGPNLEIEEAVVDISGMITIENLHEGVWTITANAMNISDVSIGTGQVEVTIVANQTVSCEIEVTPFSGVGALDLTLSWDTVSVDSPSVIISLISPLGVTVDNDTLLGGDNVYTNNSIAAGYYTLTIILQDGSEIRGGGADVVRMISGITTQASIYINTSTVDGEAGITILSDMDDPVEINLTGTVASIVEGGSFTVTAEAVGTSDVIYTWYINGNEMSSGPSVNQYTILPDLLVGTHRLDVIIFTSDGSRGGSVTHIFDVVE